MIAAHLDTVFPEGTDVKVRRDGAILHGPGIGDNCRGLAVLVAVVRLMRDAGIFRRRARSRSSPTSARRGSAICAG